LGSAVELWSNYDDWMKGQWSKLSEESQENFKDMRKEQM